VKFHEVLRLNRFLRTIHHEAASWGGLFHERGILSWRLNFPLQLEVSGTPHAIGVCKMLIPKTGSRRNVPQFFGEWKLVNVPSVPSFSSFSPSPVFPEDEKLIYRGYFLGRKDTNCPASVSSSPLDKRFPGRPPQQPLEMLLLHSK
jgi:hypothetical protein